MKQAPTLAHNGSKNTSDGEQFYLIPQALGDIVFNKLGNASAQLRIMIVLLGTKPGFNISQKWILERTGIGEKSYIEARKALVKRGWLIHTKEDSIIVDIERIYADGNAEIAETPATNACKNTPAINAGLTKPETITCKERIANTPAIITGSLHESITCNIPAINTDIINKEQNNEEQNNITKEKQENNSLTQQKPILISRAEAQYLEHCGNKLNWINETDFYINGRFVRVRDIIINRA